MQGETDAQFIGLKDELFLLNKNDLLSKLPFVKIDNFLVKYGIQSAKDRVLIIDASNRMQITQMLQNAGCDIGGESLRHAGTFIKELGIIAIKWQNPAFDIDEEIAIAKMTKTIVYESVHSDGYASGMASSQDRTGFADLRNNSGWYLEEGLCEYVAGLYLSQHTPVNWLPHLNKNLARPNTPYINVAKALESLSDYVNIRLKNEYGDIPAPATFLTPERINDPVVSTSGIAAIGIHTLVRNNTIPLELLLSARKNAADTEILQQKINAVKPGLYERLLLTDNSRSAFWETTRQIQMT